MARFPKGLTFFPQPSANFNIMIAIFPMLKALWEVELIVNTDSALQVAAHDADQDHQTSVTFSFAPESSSYRNLFLIEPNHGWITSLVPLDREKQADYEFYVQATDGDSRGGTTPLSSKSKVQIRLIDVNDCPPTFPNARMIGEYLVFRVVTAL